MANEIQISSGFQYSTATVSAKSCNLAQRTINSGTGEVQQASQTIPTTSGGTALALGNVATPGWVVIKNLDTTNYVTLMTAVSGTQIIDIPAGTVLQAYLHSTITAPALIANTAGCQIEYMVCPR